MAFADLVSELKGDFPRLSPFLAQKFVNRAWSEIRDSDNWSFLEGQATLQVPAVVNTGTISCTQFSATITGDATATTAWTPLLTGTPPFVASTNAAGQALIGTGYQIRWLNGPLYSVIASDSGSPVMTLTLDRIVSEKSGSGIAYQAFRAYYGAPATDWLNWLTIVNQAQGYPISGRRLNGSQAQLNRIDPQRTATGDPWFLFSLYADVNGMPVREMWCTSAAGPISRRRIRCHRVSRRMCFLSAQGSTAASGRPARGASPVIRQTGSWRQRFTGRISTVRSRVRAGCWHWRKRRIPRCARLSR